MALALPHLVPDSRVQGNFDELARMLSDVGSDVLNVTDFGADPSGVQDSAPAFQAAAARANPPNSSFTNFGPAQVVIPAGVYLLASTVNVPSNVIFTGQGRGTILRVTTDGTFAFTLNPGYRSSIRDLSIDATVTQTSGGGVNASGSFGQFYMADITFGSGLHTYFDGRSAGGGVSEFGFTRIKAFSLTQGATYGVSGVQYGFRLGTTSAAGLQSNQYFCQDWSMNAVSGPATLSSGYTLPQSTIAVSSMPSEMPSTGGQVWICDQLVSYTGISGNTFTGCSGGTATVPSGAPVRYAGPTWLETAYCDTFYMSNSLFQNGTNGWLNLRVPSSANRSTDMNFSKVAFDDQAFRAVYIDYARDITFTDCHLTSQAPASRYHALYIAANVDGVTWDSGTVQRCSGNGIYVDSNARLVNISDSSRFLDVNTANIGSTLNGGITNVATTLTLNDASGFPPESGYVKIGSELIRYQGRSGQQLTSLVRGRCTGQGYAVAAAHNNGDGVTYMGTAVYVAINARRYRVGGVYGNGSKGYSLGGNMDFGVIVDGGADEGRFQACDFHGTREAVGFAYDNGADTATRISGNHIVNP